MYIGRYEPSRKWAFSDRVLKEVRRDFNALAPLYQLLRGIADDLGQSMKLSKLLTIQKILSQKTAAT